MPQAVAIEFRREPRIHCDGQVHLDIEHASIPEAMARMLDVSKTGFRAAHNRADLRPGMLVRFQHQLFVGQARVVWTHPHAGRLESGFLIIYS